jgi:amino acid transporter
MDLATTLIILAITGALFALSYWRSAQPADQRIPNLNPWRIPWRTIMIFSGAAALLMLVHIVNLMGFQTGGRMGIR